LYDARDSRALCLIEKWMLVNHNDWVGLSSLVGKMWARNSATALRLPTRFTRLTWWATLKMAVKGAPTSPWFSRWRMHGEHRRQETAFFLGNYLSLMGRTRVPFGHRSDAYALM
jgi:hypothetical protein